MSSLARPNATAMMKLSSTSPQISPLAGASLPFRRGFGFEWSTRGALLLSLDNPNISSSSSSSSRKKKSLWVVGSQVNSSGSIDSPLMQSMHNKIKEKLNADTVVVKDAYGDGRHVSIDVISSAFEGQSAVNRQRMVYQAIREEIDGIVHAVDQMTTKTPTEAANS